jgi:phage terminase large subunit
MIDKPATYWHMLPAYSQGRKAIWSAVNPHTGRRRIDEAFQAAAQDPQLPDRG